MGKIINLEDKKSADKGINLLEVLNGKKVYSRFSNRLVTFVEDITDEMYEEEDGVYSTGVYTMIDNIEGIEDDCSGMYCKMKDGSTYNMEDFYAEFGAYDKNSNFPENVMNLIADRNGDDDMNEDDEETMFEAQRGFSFTVKTSYKNVEELVNVFDECGFPPVSPEYLITGHKKEGSDNKYVFDYYCGFEGYGNKFFQFGFQHTVEGGDDDLEAFVLDMLEGNFDNMSWSEALKELGYEIND